MADTGTYSIKISNTSSSPNEYLQLYWKLNGQSPETNTSNITFKLQIYSTYSEQAKPYSLDAAAEKTVSLSVNGDRKVYKHNDIWQTPVVPIDFRNTSASSPYDIAEWTGDIQHLSDGSSPEIVLNGVLYFGQESSHPGLTGNHEISYTIPAGEFSGVTGRASVPTVTSNAYFGSTIQINTNPVSQDFRHTIRVYPTDDSSLYREETNIQYDCAMVLPETWMPQYGSYRQITISCETFDGQTSLGVKTITFRGNVPESYNTRITSLVLTVSPSSNNGSGCGLSTVTATCTTHVRGSNNRIENYQWHIRTIRDGVVYEDDFSSFREYSVDLTSRLRTINMSDIRDYIRDGEYGIRVTITDSYGVTDTASTTLTIKDFSSEITTLGSKSLIVGESTSSLSLYFDRKNNSYRHSIYVKVQGGTDIEFATNVASSYQLTLPESFADNMPTKIKQKITITVYTTDNGSIVGVGYISAYAIIPSTWTPTVRRVYVRHISSQTEHPDYNGAILQGVTSVSTTAYDITAARGTQINTVRFQGPDMDATRNPESTAGPIDRTQTVNSVSTYGNIKYTVTVTDKRGLSATFESNEIEVVQYGTPVIALSAHRCNSEGQSTDFGDYYQATITGSITDLEGNLWAVYLLQRESGSQATPVEVWSLVNQNDPMPTTITTDVIAADPDKAYELLAYIDHYYIPSGETEAVLISRSDIYSMVLSTAKSIIDIYKDKLVTFFGPAEQDVLTDIGEEEAVVFDSPVYGIWNGEHQEIVPVSPIEDLDLVSVTDLDNGKILEVSDGRWSIGEYEKELPDTSNLVKEGTVYILKVQNGRWASAEKWGYDAIDEEWLEDNIWISPPQPHEMSVEVFVRRYGDNVILRPAVTLSDPNDTIIRYRWQGTGIEGFIDLRPLSQGILDVTDYLVSGTNSYTLTVSATNCLPGYGYATINI